MNTSHRINTCCIKCGSSFGLDNNLNVVLDNKPTFCNDCVSMNFNDFKYISRNKQLSGKPNPKTLIQPVITPPIADLNHWKTNNLVTFSHINSQKTEPLYESGFLVSSKCDNHSTLPFEKESKQNFSVPYERNTVEKLQQVHLQQIRTDLEASDPKAIKHENQPRHFQNMLTHPGKPSDINVSCGYYEKNPLLYNTPSNYPTSICEQSQELKSYNKNLFTQTIQPGIYTRSEVNETPNSNIGISFTQPFEPVSKTINDHEMLFTQHDPNLVSNVIEPNYDDNEPTVYNVYDPRHNGYGTSYRSYNDEFVGQPRFMYDDIDAIKNPNYIVRSHIDHLSFADKYGPIQHSGVEDVQYKNIRAMVNQDFTDSTNQFRAEMQERLMRKANNIAWQQRKAPISRNGFCAK